MSYRTMAKPVLILVVILACMIQLAGCSTKSEDGKIPVKVLILPKFEVDEVTGDFPGESQHFYDAYLAGGEEYEIEGHSEKLYYKDGVALFLTGQGKISAALSTAAVLHDDRFDFSDAYILSVGCGGAAEGYGIPGDVFVITETADFDLGHHADPREMSGGSDTTWFHDESFDDIAVIRLDQDLADKVFEMVKDVRLETTEQTERFLKKEYGGKAWADRKPKVMRGTSVTSDNFWKGKHDHQKALQITETYGFRDPYCMTEMEDIGVGRAVKQAGLLDRLIVLRVGVNTDVFPSGVTPEILWGPETEDHLASEESLESIDIFETAMQNCFSTAEVLIDAVLQGQM